MSNIFLNAPGHGQEMIQFGIMEEHKTAIWQKDVQCTQRQMAIS